MLRNWRFLFRFNIRFSVRNGLAATTVAFLGHQILLHVSDLHGEGRTHIHRCGRLLAISFAVKDSYAFSSFSFLLIIDQDVDDFGLSNLGFFIIFISGHWEEPRRGSVHASGTEGIGQLMLSVLKQWGLYDLRELLHVHGPILRVQMHRERLLAELF